MGRTNTTNGGGSGGSYTPKGVTNFTVGGISAGTDLGTTPITDQALFDKMLYGYLPPSISLVTTPSAALREFGNTIASVVLNATTVKHSMPITAVSFYRGATDIHDQTSPLANGGLESYTDATLISTATSFHASVSDGTTTVNSNTVTFNFVYPYYYGVGAKALTGTQIAGLTKLIQTQQNTTTTTSPTNQVYYFAYPAAYPDLTSILDKNGFETISDYTKRTVSIVGLDTTSQSYTVYEFNNLTTQVNFNNTYIY